MDRRSELLLLLAELSPSFPSLVRRCVDPLFKDPDEEVLPTGVRERSDDLLAGDMEPKFLIDMDFFIPDLPPDDSMEPRLGDEPPLLGDTEPKPLMDMDFFNPDRPPLLSPSPDKRRGEWSPDRRLEE